MDDFEERVLDCFARVFPEVERAELARASQASIAGWDSVRHVTLLVALGEEFQLEPDFEEGQELLSFALVLDYMRSRLEDV